MDNSTLPLLGPDDLDEGQQSLWRYIVEGPRGASIAAAPQSLPGPFGPWLHLPTFGRSAAEMGEILRLRSVLPGDLREIAILTVGVRWKAEFEFWAHAQIALREGVDESVVHALRDGTNPPFATPEQQLVHDVAEGLLATGRLSEVHRQQAGQAFGWPATVELVALIGFYCMVSFTLNAFDVALPPRATPVWAQP